MQLRPHTTHAHSSRSVYQHVHTVHPSRPLCRPANARVTYILSDAIEHAKDGHPECPARILAIRDALHQSLPNDLAVSELTSTRIASPAELEFVHTPTYVERMWQICGEMEAGKCEMVDDATYITPGSMTAAVKAVGATLDLVDHILGTTPGCDKCGFALVRPPGHHVLPSRPMGFGVLNTVSIATRYAQSKHDVRKCLIFDFDVHHGNGTMEVFWEDPTVMYISVHQANLWPYTGKDTNRGGGQGLGSTINVPLPGGAGDLSMQAVIDEVLYPTAARFKPDMIICSAGYDAHWMDPLAGLQLTTGMYRNIAQKLVQLAHDMCGGKILLVLEGGYHIESLADSVAATIQGLAQDHSSLSLRDRHRVDTVQISNMDHGLLEEPHMKVRQAIDKVKRLHGL